ncbi:acid protease [Hypoxylon fragiforme]|uniref:acid protease n=1 Tax=Hypoxylon fragiforme TaxID=63214 RepID=UPI0020C61D08|nr:acid protease [Hypoxylon fragiforme]KAI2603097.1 acid protease [Hypoxylon fragiforme]
MSSFSPSSSSRPPSRILFSIASSLLIGVGRAATFPNVTTTTMSSGSVNNSSSNATAMFKDVSAVLSLPLRRVESRGVGTPSLARRYFATEVLGVYGAAYFAELTIGTDAANPQTVDVLIDTGSFELWVNPNCSATDVTEYCEAFGHYDPTLSSTAQDLGTGFGIEYGEGSASGSYYTDDVFISGARIQDQQFGVSNSSSDVWFGILGLGRGQGGGVIDYPSVVDSLDAQGYTNSKLFSLDLGGQNAPSAAVTGEMVFGGVDTNKYVGNLAKIPTDPSDPHYAVTLTSLTLNPDPNTNAPVSRRQSPPITDPSFPLSVVVDSGTTLSLLPESLVSAIAAQFPGAQSDDNGGYTVPCDLRNGTGTVDFGFAGDGGSTVTITVGYSDFIWYGGDSCFLGVWYTEDIGVWILGDTFLRGAYVTFDQDNNALYMAEYVPCGDGSNLVPVPAGPDAAANIPGSCDTPTVAQRLPVATTTLEGGGIDPDCTDSPMLPPPASTVDRAVPGPNSPDFRDEDCDENESEEHRFAYSMDYSIGYSMGETFTASETFTSTFYRHFEYTMSEQVMTSHEMVVTTYCPGDIVTPPAPVSLPTPAAAKIETTPTTIATQTRPEIDVTRVAATVTQTLVTTERCETNTYTITSCDSVSAAGCTVGAITTEMVTILETVHVLAQQNPSLGLSTFPMSPPTFTPSVSVSVSLPHDFNPSYPTPQFSAAPSITTTTRSTSLPAPAPAQEQPQGQQLPQQQQQQQQRPQQQHPTISPGTTINNLTWTFTNTTAPNNAIAGIPNFASSNNNNSSNSNSNTTINAGIAVATPTRPNPNVYSYSRTSTATPAGQSTYTIPIASSGAGRRGTGMGMGMGMVAVAALVWGVVL